MSTSTASFARTRSRRTSCDAQPEATAGAPCCCCCCCCCCCRWARAAVSDVRARLACLAAQERVAIGGGGFTTDFFRGGSDSIRELFTRHKGSLVAELSGQEPREGMADRERPQGALASSALLEVGDVEEEEEEQAVPSAAASRALRVAATTASMESRAGVPFSDEDVAKTLMEAEDDADREAGRALQQEVAMDSAEFSEALVGGMEAAVGDADRAQADVRAAAEGEMAVARAAPEGPPSPQPESEEITLLESRLAPVQRYAVDFLEHALFVQAGRAPSRGARAHASGSHIPP